MAKASVLIVDDEPGIRFGISDYLESKGYTVKEAADCSEAISSFREFAPDVVVMDYLLPDGNAIEMIGNLKEIDSATPIIILTGHGSIELAVKALKQGAENFLTKPVELPALEVLLERVVENQRNRRTQQADRSMKSRHVFDPFIGSSQAIADLKEKAKKIAQAESPVLVLGETGTGKGVLAKWLHESSGRSEESFVDLNCAGLSKDFLETELFGHKKGAFTGAVESKTGLLEVAHRGTVFLDEIGDMDLTIQSKMLKVLEEKKFRSLGAVIDKVVDIRLIAATHQDIGLLVGKKQFRNDLYYRINTFTLRLAPLRERTEDIAPLAENLLRKIGDDLGRTSLSLDKKAATKLKSYAWPGNIREMRNILERAVILCNSDMIGVDDLLFEGSVGPADTAINTDKSLQDLEADYIRLVLAEEDGQVATTADRLGISRSSLYDKIKKYDLA